MASALTEVMARRARERPDGVALTWLPALGDAGESVTWAGLDDDAAAVAARLVADGLRTGDRVLLVHPPGLGFVRGFLGCLYGGFVPVPVYPDLANSDAARTVKVIAADSGCASAWVGDERLAAAVESHLGLRASWQINDDRHRAAPAGPGELAFLQYTSGSTRAPRGVMVSHGNLHSNIESIRRTFGHDSDSVVLSWLPAYHDMGLIGNILHPLHTGMQAYLAAPASFVRDPLRWLTAVDRYQVTTSGAPTFAYDLVNRAVAERGMPDVDLAGWRNAYCGAEPVSARTLLRFAELLADSGFDPSSFMPCYGLAEATLLVSSSPSRRGMRTRRPADRSPSTVSCGPAEGCTILVADRDGSGRLVPDGEVGEIHVQGESVASGYWGRPEATGETFGAVLADRPGEWLRTGDLGFLVDGELHVTGRVKDLIIVRGRNHHPHDVEHEAGRRLTGLRGGGVVAFADAADAGVVVVAETKAASGSAGDERAALAVALASGPGLALTDLVLVPPGAVPKTTSGKLRRSEARRRYLAGEFESRRRPEVEPSAKLVADEPISSTPSAEDVVVRAAAGILGREVPLDVPLAALGLDSLAALRLTDVILRETGADLPVHVLLDGATLADLLAAASSEAAPALADGPVRREGGLSTGQEALAFLHMIDPADDAYLISFGWEPAPGTDRAALDEALVLAALRQPELRARLVAGVDVPQRELLPARDLRAVLTPVPEKVAPEQLTAAMARAAATPLRLDEGPLLRLHVWTTGERTVYQLVVHHLVTDLWSLGVLWRDVADGYAALVDGTRPAADPHPGYDDWVADQERYLASPVATERDAELRRLLPSRPASLGLRTDRPHPRVRASSAGTVTRSLPAGAFGVAGADLMVLIAAAWAVTLYRYGTPSPVVVGVPVAGRTQARHTRIGGLCTNTAPLGLEIDPDRPVRELLAETRRQLRAATEHGMYPLARAVRAVGPARELGRFPLVETLVTLNESPVPEVAGLTAGVVTDAVDLELGALSVRTVPVPRTTSRYDLDLAVTPVPGGGHQLSLTYSSTLFDEEHAAAVLASFEATALGLRLEPGPAGSRTLRSAFTRSEVDEVTLARAERCDTVALDPEPVAAIRALAAGPSLPALERAGRVTTFADFDAAVQRLAGRIGAVAGPVPATGDREPDVPGPPAGSPPAGSPPVEEAARQQVALLLDSADEVALAMFAAWAAGQGILPLPLEFPDARLREMLADCGPRILLTGAASRDRASRLIAGLEPRPQLVDLIDPEDPDGPAPAAVGGDERGSAFTVYTSGSTGRPKGVLIRRDQLSPLIRWDGERFEFGPGTRMAQTLSLGFDFGLQELFTTLPFGGCVVVPEPADRADARSYARFLASARITALYVTPSYADQIVAANVPLPDLRVIQIGGEVLTAATVRGLRAITGPKCRLYNGYGPTEATVNCLVHEVPADVPDDELPPVLPVGRATAAARIALVDRHDLPVPVGSVGQILIGGPGVAGGYLGRPAETAERFVEDPTGRIGGTVYRSGDLAYLRPDGHFVVVGRTDRQFKVRGFRVELGEVEHLLRGLPGVRAAAALVVEEPRRLVAFVAGDGLDPADLTRSLAAHLVPATVPEQFVLLDRLPATANGKLDDAALIETAQRDQVTAVAASASPAELEAAVCRVWQVALGLPLLSADQNVFEQGAHSLVVTRVHRQLEAALHIRFPIHDVFTHPAPGDLARCLSQYRQAGTARLMTEEESS